MEFYLVGGAVRDLILGRTPKDFDFVVVGATVKEFTAEYPDALMTGKDFPVFRIRRGEDEFEIAFARQERKVGIGHTGFSVEFSPSTTLEDDLLRRDTTMNAMAISVPFPQAVYSLDYSKLVDPFGGLRDIVNKVVCNVSSYFSEDPLRVIRVARQASQLGFTVAQETVELARTIPADEICSLPGERLEAEFMKAMNSANPSRFFLLLEEMGHLATILPELAILRQIPAGKIEWHPEGDALTHTLMALDEVCKLSSSGIVRVATLFHDLGKGSSVGREDIPMAEWLTHYGHDNAGVPIVEQACKRLRLREDVTRAAMTACHLHMRTHKFHEMRPIKQVDVIMKARRSPLGCNGLSLVGRADHRGRGGTIGPEPGPDRLDAIWKQVVSTKMPSDVKPGTEKDRILQERIKTIKSIN